MQNKEHFLLNNAKSFPRVNKNLSPENCFYSTIIGAWISRQNNELLVNLPDREGPVSKKNDIETGEDLKSE